MSSTGLRMGCGLCAVEYGLSAHVCLSISLKGEEYEEEMQCAFHLIPRVPPVGVLWGTHP